MGAVKDLYIRILDGLEEQGRADHGARDPLPTDRQLLAAARVVGGPGILPETVDDNDLDMLADLREAYDTGRRPEQSVSHIWTPWGTSRHERSLGPGLIEVSTANRGGGIRVDPLLNTHVHYTWREPSGWYEKHTEWAFVALTFPDRFPVERVTEAHQAAKNWHPGQYELVFRVRVLDAESCIRRLERRRAAAAV